MATITKRIWTDPKGLKREAWQVRFVDQDGKQRAKQFEGKKDANAYRDQIGNKVREGTYTPESTSRTIKEAAELWIERAKAEGLERSTIEDYQWRCGHILALIDPDTKLARLTKPRCEQLRDDLLKAHNRTKARRILQGFRSIIKDAKRRGLIASNPAAETSIAAGKRHKRRLEVGRDIPEPAEIKSIIEAASGKAQAMACLAAFAGLSASELRGLLWTDLDLSSNSKPAVTIRQRADRWAAIGSPKSANRRRTVPLNEPTALALRAWKLAQPPITYREDGEKRQRPATLVFGTSTDKPDTPSNLQQRLLDPLQVKAGVTHGIKLDKTGKPALKAIRVDGKKIMQPIPAAKYSWHKLRHYAITTWLRSCQGDFKWVQYLAGHATLALTLDTYGHLIPRRDSHEMMAAVERELFGSTASSSL